MKYLTHTCKTFHLAGVPMATGEQRCIQCGSELLEQGTPRVHNFPPLTRVPADPGERAKYAMSAGSGLLDYLRSDGQGVGRQALEVSQVPQARNDALERVPE